LTLAMIQEVHDAMKKANLGVGKLWGAYALTKKKDVKTPSQLNQLIDIVSLLRFELGISPKLAPYTDIVDSNFQKWTFAKNAGHVHFTEEQMRWLRMVKDFIADSLAITAEDFELTPFNDVGGLGKFYELFGDNYQELLDEMNLALAA
jgi:type I restriction enzyme R subunit